MNRTSILTDTHQGQISLKISGTVTNRDLGFFIPQLIEASIEYPTQMVQLDFFDSMPRMELMDIYDIVNTFEQMDFSKELKVFIVPSNQKVYEDFFSFFERVFSNKGFSVMIAEPI